LPERVTDFVSLMKPRVMLLAVFTAVVGLAIMRHSFRKERHLKPGLRTFKHAKPKY